jgi:hypothetical protein
VVCLYQRQGELTHCGTKEVVTISGHHVTGVSDIDKPGVRKQLEQRFGGLARHYVTAPSEALCAAEISMLSHFVGSPS